MCDEKVDRLCWIALLVADIDEDASKTRQLTAAVGSRDEQPRLGHQASKPAVLSATVLPPVLGPVMTSRRNSPPNLDVDRHDRLRVEQRVAGLAQVRIALTRSGRQSAGRSADICIASRALANATSIAASAST